LYLAIFIVVLALSSSLLISKKTGVEQVTTESKLDTSFTPAVNPDAVQLPPAGPAQ